LNWSKQEPIRAISDGDYHVYLQQLLYPLLVLSIILRDLVLSIITSYSVYKLHHFASLTSSNLLGNELKPRLRTKENSLI